MHARMRSALAGGAAIPIIRAFFRGGMQASMNDQTARNAATDKPIAIIMGSQSDWETMRNAAETLEALGIGHDCLIVSAHRTPERMFDFAKGAKAAGYKIIIAGAGGAAHLPGMVAAATPLPVIGVPVPLRTLDGMDSLLSIVQMPAGVPVATVAIGNARNAGLLAVRILAAADPALRARMVEFQEALADMVLDKDRSLREKLVADPPSGT